MHRGLHLTSKQLTINPGFLRQTTIRTIMRQAQITAWVQTPICVEAPDPPTPAPDEVRVKVLASGLHRVVQSRATGQHYSATTLPHIPGIDGVGTTDDGRMVYFMTFATGTMTEYINIPKRIAMPLAEGVDPIQAAAVVNPAMSSWAALKLRTTNLPQEFNVLILGATSASGRVAVSLARSLGAKRVIGVARNEGALQSLGVDEQIVLQDDVKKTDFSNVGDVDVILDYVYGPPAVHLLESLKTTKPVEYVQIGSLSGIMEMALPGAVLRSKALTIRGSGPGAWSTQEMGAVMPDLLVALQSVPKQAVRVAKLADIETEWKNSSGERVVFVP